VVAETTQEASVIGFIKKHWKYASYVLRHKFFVMIECFKHGLIWRGLMHDLSKLCPGEWCPYANYFYPGGKPRLWEGKEGYIKPTETEDAAFDFAWLLHQKRNDHHHQWWVLPKDDGTVKCIPMSPASRLEMLCDWKGAGRAQGYGNDPTEWYLKNKDKMKLHPETRAWIEQQLGVAIEEE
jgi:hypothetical protein